MAGVSQAARLAGSYDLSVVVVGVVLIVVAVVLVLMDWDGLSKRMPTQVPPRGLAIVPLLLGIALVAVGLTL
jgi:uncharacterized membrane protein HdeD (DUF308 family)